MKKYPALVFILIFSINTVFGQNDNNSYTKAEKEINTIYQKILREYSSDKAFIKNLKATQRIWIQFRDAEVKARYPNQTSGYYGSVYPECVSNLKTQLTNERIKTLKVWLVGIEEGDVCAGSVKRKN
ncbi:lysozyme inhibitor LprI family protein [Dyadobacter psychrotolerans]|uniref:DUF1311 domain-containing protein n=1 Tax=Dyadobacter psychrotolerans TaxID=2541721 RepID=A0A4R5DH65_9BACT|nr:lysozyme inhibitor LprI family protein [Dyadobacter psychrotolerans]TDE11261.1 DUF1311 domain-containing protein [Dyadobacter psychrotolerans]